MSKNKDIRELRKLLYENSSSIHSKTWDLSSLVINSLSEIDLVDKCLSMISHDLSKKFRELVSNLKLTNEDIIKLSGYDIKSYKSYSLYIKSKWKYKNGMVSPVRRDNKSSVNRGSGAQGNYVRYPSKKRSLYTWRNFYKLFPWLAKEDEWNGRTSKRYNNENNKGRKSK